MGLRRSINVRLCLNKKDLTINQNMNLCEESFHNVFRSEPVSDKNCIGLYLDWENLQSELPNPKMSQEKSKRKGNIHLKLRPLQ